MLQSVSRLFTRLPLSANMRSFQVARRGYAKQVANQATLEDLGSEGESAHSDELAGAENETDVAFRYQFDENHIEVTGIVKAPPKIYTLPTGRQYAIIKLSTASSSRRSSDRFVSFLDIFAPRNAIDYIKENVREGEQLYVSGQLRSRMRTDEDGRPFQEVRVHANGLFKLMDSRVLFDSVGDDVAITDTKDAATESAGVNNTESNTDNAKKTETVSEKDGQGKK